MSRETNMTVGRPTKLILGLAVPLILTNVGQQLYTVADASIVGRGVGVEALAALGATDWLYWLGLWTVQAMTQGFSVLVSQTFGSNDKKGLRKAITMSVLLCAAVGILLTVVFVSSAGWLLHLLDTPENIYDGAHIYLTMMYAGTLITMAYNMAAAILRALGDGKSPLIAMFTAGCLNIVLDLLFVIRFGWGIPGAAAATLLAQLFAFAYCVIALRKIPAASVEKPDWQPYLIATDAQGNTSYHSQNPAYKYVVVRKGYEHPEIAAKMISVMFDKIRYECDSSEEFEKYYQLNVEPTARPLAINVDYNNALELCYEDIAAVFSGEKQEDDLKLLEKSYYTACKNYMENKESAGTDAWAAYMTRIKACEAIREGSVITVPSLYFKTTKTMKSEWWKLKENEKEAYLKIICGEEPPEYFDIFVRSWQENGGAQITDEVKAVLAAE